MLATPLRMASLILATSILGACAHKAQQPTLASRQSEATSLIFEAMDKRRARGLTPWPVPLAKSLPTIVDASTKQPVAKPFSWPGSEVRDPMVVGALSYDPVKTNMEGVFSGVELSPHRGVLAAIPFSSSVEAIPSQGVGYIHDSLLTFLKDALERRGLADHLKVGPRSVPAGPIVWARATDRFEDLLALAGGMSTRMSGDPVIVDDDSSAFQRTPAGWSVVQSADGNMTTRSQYGTSYHVINDDGACAWVVKDLSPGRWGVLLFWDGRAELSTSAQISIFTEGYADPGVVWTVDQTGGNGGFNRLGDWIAATSRSILVEIKSTDGKPVIADAVAFVQIDDINPILQQEDEIEKMGPPPARKSTSSTHGLP